MRGFEDEEEDYLVVADLLRVNDQQQEALWHATAGSRRDYEEVETRCAWMIS